MESRLAAALTLLVALTGNADAQLVDCLGGQRPTQVAELMFGRNIGRRLGVNEAEWSRFVDNEIVSRFPKGLTVVNAAGEWREGGGQQKDRRAPPGGGTTAPRAR